MEDRFRLRAWDIDEKAMVDLFSDGNLRDKDGIIHGSYQDLMESDSFSTPMQCTALRDKYGKLIYEGDIVKYTSRKSKTNPDKKPYTENFKVAWDNNYTGYNLQNVKGINCLNLAIVKTQIEVIGNKYENPELLKGGEEC